MLILPLTVVGSVNITVVIVSGAWAWAKVLLPSVIAFISGWLLV